MKRSDFYSATIYSNVEVTITRDDNKVIKAMGNNITLHENRMMIRALSSGHSLPYDKIASVEFKTIYFPAKAD